MMMFALFLVVVVTAIAYWQPLQRVIYLLEQLAQMADKRNAHLNQIEFNSNELRLWKEAEKRR